MSMAGLVKDLGHGCSVNAAVLGVAAWMSHWTVQMMVLCKSE